MNLSTPKKIILTSLLGLIASYSIADNGYIDQLKKLNYAEESGELKLCILTDMAESEGGSVWQTDLLKVLTDKSASIQGRQLAGELLQLCFTGDNAAELFPLLSENEMSSLARNLLEGLPESSSDEPIDSNEKMEEVSEEDSDVEADADIEETPKMKTVDEAFIEALASTQGIYQQGILDSLAKRKASEAIPAIINLVQSSENMDTIATALRSIARIGGEAAGEFFEDNTNWLKQAAPLANAYAEAAMILINHPVADEFLSDSSREDLAEKVFESKTPQAIRTAALIQLQMLDPESTKQFRSLMESEEASDLYLAAAIIPYLELDEKSESKILKDFHDWSMLAQQLTVTGFLDTDSNLSLKAARLILNEDSEEEDKSEELTLWCLGALAKKGDLSDAKQLFPFTLEKGDLAESAIVAIGGMADDAINDWIVEEMSEAEVEEQQALLNIMVARSMTGPLQKLLTKVDVFEIATQKSIYRALGDLGGAETVETLINKRTSAARSIKSEIERAIVDIARRHTSADISKILIAEWVNQTGSEKDRVLRMISSINHPSARTIVRQLILETEPNPIALRGVLATQDFSDYELISDLLKREDLSDANRKSAWVTLFRLTKFAVREWYGNRQELWESCYDQAPDTDSIRSMIAYTQELPRAEFISWLESIAVPEVESARQAAIETIREIENI